jgi:hypothetical protein
MSHGRASVAVTKTNVAAPVNFSTSLSAPLPLHSKRHRRAPEAFDNRADVQGLARQCQRPCDRRPGPHDCACLRFCPRRAGADRGPDGSRRDAISSPARRAAAQALFSHSTGGQSVVSVPSLRRWTADRRRARQGPRPLPFWQGCHSPASPSCRGPRRSDHVA